MPFGLQLWEILLVLAVALLIFGPKRLPEMGKSLGRGLREFKNSISGKDDDDEDERIELPPPDDEERVATPARERDTVT